MKKQEPRGKVFARDSIILHSCTIEPTRLADAGSWDRVRLVRDTVIITLHILAAIPQRGEPDFDPPLSLISGDQGQGGGDSDS